MKSTPRWGLVFCKVIWAMVVVLEVGSTESALAYPFAMMRGAATVTVISCSFSTIAESPGVKLNVP